MNVLRSLKAIFIGILFIIIVSLILQLVALFVMVAYTHLEQGYPFFKDISGVFRYLVGMPIFMLIMFVGGYITAALAKTRVLIHCFIVGFITATAMILLALENATLTTAGIFIFIIMIVVTIAGGYYWRKNNAREVEKV